MTTPLREILLEIRRENAGELRPQYVVEAARAEDHPLHNRFEWDDEIAGERYRLSQARKLIRTCRISIDDGDENRDPQQLRAFVSVPGPQGRPVYDPVENIAENPVMRAVVIKSMMRDWQTFKRRYQRYVEFFQMVADDPDVISFLKEPVEIITDTADEAG